MAIDTLAILQALQSHAAATGHLERFELHEPIRAPDADLTWAVWIQSVTPVPARSGLQTTSVRIVATARFYQGTQTERDSIDPRIMAAADALLAAYNGDFTLDGLIAEIDILGAYDIPLNAQAGYVTYPDGTTYRVFDLTIPMVLNDVWTQAP